MSAQTNPKPVPRVALTIDSVSIVVALCEPSPSPTSTSSRPTSPSQPSSSERRTVSRFSECGTPRTCYHQTVARSSRLRSPVSHPRPMRRIHTQPRLHYILRMVRTGRRGRRNRRHHTITTTQAPTPADTASKTPNDSTGNCGGTSTTTADGWVDAGHWVLLTDSCHRSSKYLQQQRNQRGQQNPDPSGEQHLSALHPRCRKQPQPTAPHINLRQCRLPMRARRSTTPGTPRVPTTQPAHVHGRVVPLAAKQHDDARRDVCRGR